MKELSVGEDRHRLSQLMCQKGRAVCFCTCNDEPRLFSRTIMTKDSLRKRAIVQGLSKKERRYRQRSPTVYPRILVWGMEILWLSVIAVIV